MSYQLLRCDEPGKSAILVKRAVDAAKNLDDKTMDCDSAEAALLGADIWKKNVSSGVRLALELWKDNQTSTTLVLDDFISGVDFEKILPPTPVKCGLLATEKQMRWADVLLLGLMELLDLHPTAIHAENGGHLMRNVVPAAAKTNALSSHGSKMEFSWHSDQLNCNLARTPIHAACPDMLCFFVVRNLEEVKTKIVSNEHIMDNLKYKSVRLLKQPYFNVNKPQSLDQVNDELFPKLTNAPVIIDNGDGTSFIRYDPQAVEVTNKADRDHAKALKNLKSVLRRLKSDPITFEPGQFIMFKNRKVMHSREAFERHPNADLARWLRRIYGVYRNLA